MAVDHPTAPRSEPRPLDAPKKVGVLTLPFNVNIGGNLQGYAMMEALRQLGHLPVLINRRGPPKTINGEAANPEWDAGVPLVGNTIAMSPPPNREFIEKYVVPISRQFSSSDELRANIGRYDFDAIIVGSDQVWRPKYTKTSLPDYFLGFLGDEHKETRRISYAPSFGAVRWEYDEEQTATAASLIKRFDAVSVREDSAVDLCRQHFGVEAEHVLDPTMLLSSEHYAMLAASKAGRPSSGQLLAYILDRTPDKTLVIETIVSRLSVGAYTPDGLPLDADEDGAAGDKTVEGWLASIHDAVFVITDSFHGTVFSILFNKPFIVYGNPHRGLARFTSLLKMFGLEDRMVAKSTDIDIEKMLRPIDWTAVNRRLETLRARSKRFLTAALSGERVARRETEASAASGQPSFSTNNDGWRVSSRDGHVALSVAPGAAIRGNYAWHDLPSPLRAKTRYRLRLTWRVRSTTPVVGVHVRNSRTGAFHLIAKLTVSGEQGAQRVDVVNFILPVEGFDQFMLGAIYFTGDNAGADIIDVSMQDIQPALVQPATAQASAPAAQAPVKQTPVPQQAQEAAPSYFESVQKLAASDSKRYAETFVRGEMTRGVGLIHARLMFYAHALEKGLSRSDFRPRFGGSVLRIIATEMSAWLKEGRSDTDPFIKTAAATASAYFERHRQLNVDASDFFKMFDARSQALIMAAQDEYGGVLTADAPREAVLETNVDRNFMDVVFGRRSVREFTRAPIDPEDVRRAVRIAQQAPSVCNRQGVRVHQFEDQAAIGASLELQGGFKGYALPPMLLLVTTDLTAFLSPNERNQGFVDGACS